MLKLYTPRGLDVDVPEIPVEDCSPKFKLSDVADISDYFKEYGYVIIQGLIPRDRCDAMRQSWDSEVKPFKGFMYRQATAHAERHVVNDRGWVMNPILNIQSIDPTKFGNFRDYVTTQCLASSELRQAFYLLLGENPKIVQSMYFEGNSATWEHQDSYYLDSEVPGEMCGAWIALEDISASAGRFFICPKSHKLVVDDHNLSNNIAENHEQYKLSVSDMVRKNNLQIRAPILNKGDVLFWNSWTIHGSLDSQDADHSRSSITCHAIPRSRKYLQMHTRILDLRGDDIGGTEVHRPKDLMSLKNRLILFVESTFPRQFYWLKKRAIVFVIKRRRASVVSAPQLIGSTRSIQ
jgi:phytanoyl-CoA hydroxylase